LNLTPWILPLSLRIVENNTIAIRLVERIYHRADESDTGTSDGEEKRKRGVPARENSG
jgi:hypothetical protein